MTYEEQIRKAEQIGTEQGEGAASWYFDRDTDYDTYKAVVDGLEDGDPEILDTFPTSPLSAEWADTYSLADLAEDTDCEQDSDAFDDVCRAYEDAFYTASQDEIARVAHLHSDPSQAVSELDTSCAYKVDGSEGIAWTIIGPAGGDNVRLRMIGDDQTFTFDVEDLQRIDEEDYCPECGQIGCKAYA